jgi:hypothetical protein
MSKWTWGVWCLALVAAEATAAEPSSRQPVKVLYHERLALAARAEPAGHLHISFEAYGRRFELSLEPNEGIGRGVPASRSDIQPLQGKLDGQPGSWARLTQIRGVWRGVISDGHELYAIEPGSEVAAAAVQPPETTDRSAPLIYRFSDTLMSGDGGLCGTGESVDSAISLAAYNDVAPTADQSSTLQLTVSVVADHAFSTAVGDDNGGGGRIDIALLALLGTLLIARRAQLLLRLLAGIPSDAKAVEVHQDPRRRRRGTRHRNDGLPRIRLAARHRAH